MLQTCPICGGRALLKLVDYERSVTSDSQLIDAPVNNSFCNGCGIVLNATGVRGSESAFYRETYALLTETDDAEFKYVSHNVLRGVNDELVDFLEEHTTLSRRGKILEIGAGKGVFMTRFLKAHPHWNITVVEPNKFAVTVLSRRISKARIYAGNFEVSPFVKEHFDLIVSIGVLEHVSDPVGFLRGIRRCLNCDGLAMIGVPNFLNNPTDLLTYDHLTRFTPESLRSVLGYAGLRALSWNVQSRVPMWVLAEADPQGTTDVQPEKKLNSLLQAQSASDWVSGSLDVFDQIGKQYSQNGRLGIYGTGSIAIAAENLTCLSRIQIACFIDDNEMLHRGERLGRPIVSMKNAASKRLTDIAFSANPCYLPVMERKVKELLGPYVRLWPLPTISK